LETLESVASSIESFLNPDDRFVDFCCGSNNFGQILHRRFGIPWVAFDVFPAQNMMNFVRKNWFDVLPSDVPGNLVIGLSPPLVLDQSIAKRFVQHALLFKPRMVLLLPKAAWLPSSDSYRVVYQNEDLWHTASSYVSGTPDRSQVKTMMTEGVSCLPHLVLTVLERCEPTDASASCTPVGTKGATVAGQSIMVGRRSQEPDQCPKDCIPTSPASREARDPRTTNNGAPRYCKVQEESYLGGREEDRRDRYAAGQTPKEGEVVRSIEWTDGREVTVTGGWWVARNAKGMISSPRGREYKIGGREDRYIEERQPVPLQTQREFPGERFSGQQISPSWPRDRYLDYHSERPQATRDERDSERREDPRVNRMHSDHWRSGYAWTHPAPCASGYAWTHPWTHPTPYGAEFNRVDSRRSSDWLDGEDPRTQWCYRDSMGLV